MKSRKFLLTILTIVVLSAVALMLSAASPFGSGLINHRYSTLFAGATDYVTATTYSAATDVGLFGTMELHGIAAILPSTGTLTATVQWSNQTVPCASVTQWTSNATVFNPNGYAIGAATTTSIVTGTSLMTGTTTTIYTTSGAGAMTRPYLSYVADAADASSLSVIAGFPILARCVRVMLEPGPVTTHFTPTLYLRLVNHY